MITPDDPRHGERRGYIAGCRDGCCSRANTEYMAVYKSDPSWRERQYKANKECAHRRHMLAAAGVPGSQLAMEPVREHISRLMGLGWTSRSIAALHGGVSYRLVWEILNVDKQFIQRKTATLLDVPYSMHVPNRVPDYMMVPYLGAKRRTEALFAFGWPRELQLEHGAPGRVAIPQLSITAKRWRQIDSVFQDLSSKPGPSRTVASRAKAMGYLTAGAWDDIDNPDEDPTKVYTGDLFDEVAVMRRCGGDRKVRLSDAEYVEVVRRLHYEDGLSFLDVERRAGLNVYRYKKAAAEAHAGMQKGEAA